MPETKVTTTENKDQPNPASDPRADERLAEMRRAAPPDQPAPTTQGRPTPTQNELDRIVLGEHVTLEPDGSPEQHHHGAAPLRAKSSEELRADAEAARRNVVGLPPYETPVPTQAQLDSIARGDHLKKSPRQQEQAGSGPRLPEGAVVPEGMQHIPPEEQRREKAGEPDGDKAGYKTRESHPDKQRSGRGGEKKKDEEENK